MSILERNERAKMYVLEQINIASQLDENYFKELEDYLKTSDTLNKLIFVKAMGFRGVVATALTGQYLDPTFDFLNNFYSCKPRSIFENGIFYAFEEHKIPCGKSDPLNVAKNTSVLNEEWAKGKRPESAAVAAVNFLRLIKSTTDQERKSKLISFFFFRLICHAKECNSIEIITPEVNKLSNQVIANKLIDFSLTYPESGTIPQLVVSTLLEKIFENTSVTVYGGNESVFGTNTTSKKPADIWLKHQSQITCLYEITVKKIDRKRLDDCLQSLNKLELTNHTIHFICRLPDDISTLDCDQERSLAHKGKTFNFIDIRDFIKSALCLMTNKQAEEVVSILHDFVKQTQRPIITKNGWNECFGC